LNIIFKFPLNFSLVSISFINCLIFIFGTHFYLVFLYLVSVLVIIV